MKVILLVILLFFQAIQSSEILHLQSYEKFSQPNLYDPICQVGVIRVNEGNYYINNFKIRIRKKSHEVGNANEDRKIENIWEKLWGLKGKKVIVEGHRGRNVEDYDHVFVTSIKIIQ